MKKVSLSIIEIMIAIFLITLISGAIGYNMKGTLDKGRAFRTELAKEQLENLLFICLEEGDSADDILKNPAQCLKKRNLAKNSEKIVHDGWGNPFTIQYNKKSKSFSVHSDALQKYQENTGKK